MKKTIENMLKIYRKYKMPLLYLFFGGLTTLINIIAYFICHHISNLTNVTSTVIAWILSVILAFITNKFYVFESKSKSILFELVSFFTCRLGTGILDLSIMYLTVDVLKWNDLLMKIISNVIVILLNYILSKLIIFKKE